jgi:hypothetical protein
MQVSHETMGKWMQLRAMVVRGWMAAGAMALGMGTSPTYAMMMQPRGEARVVRSAGSRDGDAPSTLPGGLPGTLPGALPGALVDPCDPLGGAMPSKQLLEALDAASRHVTPLEMLASVPEPMRSSIERALAGPARFHAALFGNELGAPPIVPMYQLTEAPATGATVRALAGDATVGFEATIVSVESLDLAAGARALGDPTRVVLPGEAAWNVSGVGMRDGRVAEFQGMVVAVTSREGLGHWLIIEQDTICADPLGLDTIADADRGDLLDDVKAWRSEVANQRMLMALDITAWLRWCVNNLQRVLPWLALRCWLVLMADRVIGNLIVYLVLTGRIRITIYW